MQEEKKKITVLIKPVDKEAYVTEIEDDYKKIQEIVGGRFECVEMPTVKNVDIYVNEEGLLEGLAGNFWLPEYQDCVKGACMIVGYNPRNGNTVSLNDKQIKGCLKYIKQYELPQNTDLYLDFHYLETIMNSRYKKFQLQGEIV